MNDVLKVAKAFDPEIPKFDHELVKAFEVLRTAYSREELSRSIRILKGVVRQLDGRTVGLVAYNSWNTHPVTCWCSNAPHGCPCKLNHNSEPEKWMSIASDLDKLDLVVCVEVSDVAGVGLALKGEVIYRDWGGGDCDLLPERAMKLLDELEKLNGQQ